MNRNQKRHFSGRNTPKPESASTHCYPILPIRTNRTTDDLCMYCSLQNALNDRINLSGHFLRSEHSALWGFQ